MHTLYLTWKSGGNVDMLTMIKNFHDYISKIHALRIAVGLMYWDQGTIGAPKAGSEQMAKVMGILIKEALEMSISQRMKQYLDDLLEAAGLDEITMGCLRLCRRTYDKFASIPPEEYGKFMELTVNSRIAWEKAKIDNNFTAYAPYLERLIAFKKKFVAYRNIKAHPYDVLLDDYEPEMTVGFLDDYFEKLKANIIPLLKKIMSSKKKIRTDFVKISVKKDIQEKITYILLNTLGYDFSKGKLAESMHPFSISFNQNDCRIATNYRLDDFMFSYFCTAHECGHAIYEMGKRHDLLGTILEMDISTALHESQSRFYENIVCRSYEFWTFIYDKIKTYLGSQFSEVTARDFYEVSNKVSPSLIRIEADELTYPLHIMIRYELEKLIFSGDIDVYELPKLWNYKYEEYLGVCPSTDSEGILQDVHWAEGMFGYFPSYSLGDAYGAQLRHYMMKDFNLYEAISNGEISKVTDWLREKIHQYGSLYTASELIVKGTGEPLNVDYYIKYLNDKYSELYEI